MRDSHVSRAAAVEGSHFGRSPGKILDGEAVERGVVASVTVSDSRDDVGWPEGGGKNKRDDNERA